MSEEPFRTERLILRRWRRADCAPFAAMNADPRVMQYFRSTLSRAESEAAAARIAAHFDEHGFGLWAIEISGVTEFAGFCGLSIPAFAAPFMPCVEIGWRLAAEHWHHGYATEAASAVRDAAFERFGLHEIVSFTTAANLPYAPRHGTHRHAPRSGRLFRLPGPAGGLSPAPSCPVPDGAVRSDWGVDVLRIRV